VHTIDPIDPGRDRERVLDGGPHRARSERPEEPAMFTRQFWKLTAERAVKVFAETLAGVLVVSGVGLFSTDWKTALSTALMAAFVSVLTSVASLKMGEPNSPSVVRSDPPPPPAAIPAGATTS
jgi:hypothetical protein